MYIVPLLVIVLGFDLLSGEQELQTLRVILTQHVHLATFLLAKSLCCFLIIWIPVAVYMLSGVAVFEPALFREPATLFIVSLVVAGYILFWLALCLVVNLLRNTSLFNGVILLITWIVLLFLAPTALHLHIQHTVPSDPPYESLVKLRKEGEKIRKDHALARLYLKHPEWKPENIISPDSLLTIPWYPGFIAWNQECAARKDSMLYEQENVLLKQEDRVKTFSPALPPLFVSSFFHQLGQVSTKDFIGFRRTSRAFYRDWQWYLADRIFRKKQLNERDLQRNALLEYN